MLFNLKTLIFYQMLQSPIKTIVEVSLSVIPVVTFLGKRKYLYQLSDSAYGEWLIYENHNPKYYLNIFDEEYVNIKNKITQTKINVEDFLREKFNSTQPKLTIDNTILGIKLIRQTSIQKISLEKLPITLIE